ncbi:hypothetical protein [Paenibacillus piri]|nr:hypothetical protein [Paenibacillus piri]
MESRPRDAIGSRRKKDRKDRSSAIPLGDAESTAARRFPALRQGTASGP